MLVYIVPGWMLHLGCEGEILPANGVADTSEETSLALCLLSAGQDVIEATDDSAEETATLVAVARHCECMLIGDRVKLVEMIRVVVVEVYRFWVGRCDLRNLNGNCINATREVLICMAGCPSCK